MGNTIHIRLETEMAERFKEKTKIENKRMGIVIKEMVSEYLNEGINMRNTIHARNGKYGSKKDRGSIQKIKNNGQ